MSDCGRGVTLALIAAFSLFLPAGVNPQPVGGTAAEAFLRAGFPVIGEMNRRDAGFRQYIADVEANRRLVFLRGRRADVTADSIAGALTIYSYTVREGDDLFSLAARGNIPFSALASLNRLGNRTDLRPGMTLLLPSVPGIFVPEEPASDLERLMASARFEEGGDRSVLAVPAASGGNTAFLFFPGDEFSQAERAFFLNPGIFRFPLRSFRVTSGYGMRPSPVSGRMHFHRGIDLAAPAGTEILAAAGGVVAETGFDRVLGYFVRISHAGNWTSLYGHMQRIAAETGSRVASGEVIGWVGSTGYSTGPHLHFELWQGGRSRDPAGILRH